MEKFLISAMLTISLCLHAQVGIQTSTPDLNSDLTLGSPDKGLLINRVALKNTSNSSPLTENAPAGMLVYNTQTTTHLSPGVYVYDGEDWGEVNVKTPTQGNKLTKIMYKGKSLDPPTLKIPEMNMEFRLYPESENSNVLEYRLLTPPNGEVTYISSMTYGPFSGNPAEIAVFTPANYNTWKTHMYSIYFQSFWGIKISTNTGVIPGGKDLNTGVFYGFSNLGLGSSNPDDLFYILTFDLY